MAVVAPSEVVVAAACLVVMVTVTVVGNTAVVREAGSMDRAMEAVKVGRVVGVGVQWAVWVNLGMVEVKATVVVAMAGEDMEGVERAVVQRVAAVMVAEAMVAETMVAVTREEVARAEEVKAGVVREGEVMVEAMAVVEMVVGTTGVVREVAGLAAVAVARQEASTEAATMAAVRVVAATWGAVVVAMVVMVAAADFAEVVDPEEVAEVVVLMVAMQVASGAALVVGWSIQDTLRNRRRCISSPSFVCYQHTTMHICGESSAGEEAVPVAMAGTEAKGWD